MAKCNLSFNDPLDAVRFAEKQALRSGRVFCVVWWSRHFYVKTKAAALRGGFRVVETINPNFGVV